MPTLVNVQIETVYGWTLGKILNFTYVVENRQYAIIYIGCQMEKQKILNRVHIT